MKNKKLNIFIILVLTLLVLYISLKDDYKEIAHNIVNAKFIWLVVAYFFVTIYTLFKAVATNEMISSFRPAKIVDTFKLQLMTFFFNSITPFASGGQPFQIYVLKKNHLSLTQATNVVLQETIVHQFSFALVMILTLTLNKVLNIFIFDYTLKLFVFLGFSINALAIIMLCILAYSKKAGIKCMKFMITILAKMHIIKRKEEKIEKWCNRIERFNAASKTLLASKRKLVYMVFMNFLAIICLYITPLIILFSLGDYTSLNIASSVVLVSFVSIVSSFVPLPGGSLGQEYLFTVFFAGYVKNAMLSSLMILWRVMTYYVPMIIGSIFFNLHNKK